jgi:hypothetical protein
MDPRQTIYFVQNRENENGASPGQSKKKGSAED